jgi:hypothetical protein
MTTKSIIAIAAIGLTTLAGTAQAGVSLGGTGEYGDIYAQANPGERIHTIAATTPAMGKAAFGTPSGASSSRGDVLQFGSVHLGGVGAYGDVYPQANPGQRAW